MRRKFGTLLKVKYMIAREIPSKLISPHPDGLKYAMYLKI